jgi:hypothetical protein
MPEVLATADGRRIDLDESDRAFAAAMAAPRRDEPEAPAPPKREPVDPEAPYGRKVDGTPKKSPGGRPPKPRVIEAPRGAEKPQDGRKDAAPAQDYSQGLSEFTEALWMVLAATPVPWPEMRVKVRAQAYVLQANQGGVVQGVNAMAQHNGTIRWGVEKLTTGSAGWVLPAVMALAPFAVQSAMIWRAPANGDMERIAAETERQWEETFAAMKAEFAKEAEFMANSAEETEQAAA